MGKIPVSLIEKKVAELCVEANFDLPPDVEEALKRALQEEESPLGREILKDLWENLRIAREERIPICQDTGMVVVFVELGQEVEISGGSLTEAINRGVARGYQEGYLRKSVVSDPLRRVNTGDNTPAVIHYEVVPGNVFRITVMPKGFGSENCTALGMLKPADGVEGVKRFVIGAVDKAAANPCPPVTVGVGIGGTAEKALLLAKRALLRPIGSLHSDPFLAQLEKDLKEEINNLGYGPGGFGGRFTALAVHIETYPTHIAGLPVAVNINCHASRHKTWVWDGESDE
ncbi:MAG: Fumarate hydratase, subunit alpha [Thermoanaerobacterales bacterium 50_218]|nr:MAG: Fumarate hydratase, subunit alpha [Thermoanaerobacterales bacterium 50_218]HAA89906.1 fumarate hydratase [Peptococcaceae bacterium]